MEIKATAKTEEWNAILKKYQRKRDVDEATVADKRFADWNAW